MLSNRVLISEQNEIKPIKSKEMHQIIFNISKKEMFSPLNGFKGLENRLLEIAKVSM